MNTETWKMMVTCKVTSIITTNSRSHTATHYATSNSDGKVSNREKRQLSVKDERKLANHTGIRIVK